MITDAATSEARTADLPRHALTGVAVPPAWPWPTERHAHALEHGDPCGEQDPATGLLCTENADHRGDHAAHDRAGRTLKTWERRTPDVVRQW